MQGFTIIKGAGRAFVGSGRARPGRALAIAGVLAAGLLAFAALPGTAQAGNPTSSQAAALERLQADSSAPVSVEFEAGTARFVRAQVATDGSDPAERALSFLERYADLYGLDAPREQLRVLRESGGEDGQDVVFQQSGGKVPVFGAQVAVHLQEGAVVATNGAYLASVPRPKAPSVDAEAAIRVAREAAGHRDAELVGEPRLEYFDADLFLAAAEKEAAAIDGETHQVWDVTLATRRSFVDAQTGRELFGFSTVEHAAKDLWIRSANSTGAGWFCTYPGATDWFDENGQRPNTSPDAEGVNAVTFSNAVYDYYNNNFGWKSWDGKDQEVRLNLDVVDPSFAAPNAAFIPACNHMIFTNNMATKDVIAHEFTHGVTSSTANLVYAFQPGALNESYSDVFAAMVDTANWTMGEGSAAGTIRDLGNPARFGQPAHMSGFVVVGSNVDNGGVHTNSGIPNLAAFLTAQGGVSGGFKTIGIGRSKTQQLYFRVLRSWLAPGANFLDARNATLSQAQVWATLGTNGFTQGDVCVVQNAWAAVGLGDGDADCDGIPNANETDDDNDGLADGADNCSNVANVAQTDADADGLGDACDPDIDNDGRLNGSDNCPTVSNPSQADADGDGLGNACDPTPNGDDDGDGVDNLKDNCRGKFNPLQQDADQDGIGDACDDDADNDGVKDPADNCRSVKNASQSDLDKDGVGDACDNAPSDWNPDQRDTDKDGTPDVLDPDDDNDGVQDASDNCQLVWNPTQEDVDRDGVGDACMSLSLERDIHLAFMARDKYFERFQILVKPCLKCGKPGDLLELKVVVEAGMPLELRVLDERGEPIASGLSNEPLMFEAKLGEDGSPLDYQLEILPSPEFEVGNEYPFSVHLESPDWPR